MSLQSDHKALIFFASVAVLGAGVRVVRASARESAGASQPALEQQVQAADSSAHAGRGRGKQAKAKRTKGNAADSAGQQPASGKQTHRDANSPNRPGWIGGKLDLDVATAAQLDSLPGVTPMMAKRIVADRMKRGPFLNRVGLQRVPGTGPRFLAAIDSLITFSGTLAWPSPSDSVIPPAKAARKRKSSPPPP
ncbi:MAG TPA: helix-hairpin-helix domain-containing protein [Gemmatimonadaceae bacterium]|jgi:DNA uptake protein ComE-like DNA-binding protein